MTYPSSELLEALQNANKLYMAEPASIADIVSILKSLEACSEQPLNSSVYDQLTKNVESALEIPLLEDQHPALRVTLMQIKRYAELAPWREHLQDAFNAHLISFKYVVHEFRNPSYLLQPLDVIDIFSKCALFSFLPSDHPAVLLPLTRPLTRDDLNAISMPVRIKGMFPCPEPRLASTRSNMLRFFDGESRKPHPWEPGKFLTSEDIKPLSSDFEFGVGLKPKSNKPLFPLEVANDLIASVILKVAAHRRQASLAPGQEVIAENTQQTSSCSSNPM